MRFTLFLLLVIPLLGCSSEANPDRSAGQSEGARRESMSTGTFQVGGATKDQETEVRALIEQLVFAEGPASNQPIIVRRMKIFDADGNEVQSAGETEDVEERRKQFESCEEAFQKLYDLQGLAIPILLEHLDDDRQSVNFRNHYLGNSVGDACYWNIYYQLVDQPADYSEYGYSREGRDGEQHAKPYWEGTPFDEAGGIKEWIAHHDGLNYKELQITCLEWLLEKEKDIGAPNAGSYFLNILPLEIRILERRLENGEGVRSDLERLQRIRDERIVDAVPKGLLPNR